MKKCLIRPRKEKWRGGRHGEKKNAKNGKSSKTGQNLRERIQEREKNGESGKGSISKFKQNDNTTNGNRKNRGTVKSSGKRKVTSEKRYGTKIKKKVKFY